jgi:hypothetical protein
MALGLAKLRRCNILDLRGNISQNHGLGVADEEDMSIVRIATLILFLQMLISQLCFAMELQLFRDHQYIKGYEGMVHSIEPGDVLRFSNDRTFTVDQILGQGGTTLIFSIKEDSSKAVRIPLNLAGIRYLGWFTSGYQGLVENHIPAVQVYESYDEEYAVVEKLTDFMTFSDFVDAASSSPKNTLAQWGLIRTRELPTQEMIQKFNDFASRIALYSKIGDLHAANLIYDFQKKEWRLIDWTSSDSKAGYEIAGRLYYEKDSPLESLLDSYGATFGLHFSVFKKKHQWLEAMIKQAHQTIAQRRQQSAAAGLCSKVFSF